jgi:hypothetical protein
MEFEPRSQTMNRGDNVTLEALAVSRCCVKTFTTPDQGVTQTA